MELLATDRLDLLKLFVRIAETGHVSEAARSLGLSQPTGSRCLKHLETMLETRLVQRTARRLTLTRSGEVFLASARRLLEEWDAAVEATKAEQQALSGHIRVAAPVAIGQSLLASVVSRFLKAHPGVTIEWNLRDDVPDNDTAGYDLWIGSGELRRDDLVVREIYRTRRAIIVSPAVGIVDHPQELQRENAVRLITFVPSSVELTHERGDRFALKQSAVLATDNLFAARTAVLEHVGYAILPLWSVQSHLDSGALVHTCPAWHPADVTLWLAYAAGSRPARVQALVDYMKAELTRRDGLGIAFLNELGAGETVRLAVANGFET